ncbi:hypothetical protein [Burkholderia pseudomultivorans]|uniref:hypothetical protein n=1 Tax=Burkholderia pseudomultivorans TaxID=1207504 RepID=UPI001581DB50|nr:hypothetical protein [Burkholderia pseudomultivorans]
MSPYEQAMSEIRPLLAILLAKKKSDLSKLCKETVITENAFCALISACTAAQLPWQHQMSYRDIMPNNLQYTDQDSESLGRSIVGPLKKSAMKAWRKWHQILKDRRYLVGHIFYTRDHSNWHLFYFDNRDLTPYENHFKHGGPHIHLINHLWPDHTCESLWTFFQDDNPKMTGAEHIRFHREHLEPPNW